jgi:hypothetical protein
MLESLWENRIKVFKSSFLTMRMYDIIILYLAGIRYIHNEL